MIPRDEATNFVASDISNDTGKTPTETHAEFMHASEPSLLPPTMLSLWISSVMMRASSEESLYEAFNRRW